MIPGNLARRYARALLELADTPAKRDRFDKDIEALGAAFDLPDELGSPLGRVLEAGRFPLAARKGVAQSICKRVGADPMVVKFIDYVVEQGRTSGISQMAMHYRDLADQQANRVRATVTSAQKLAPDAINKIKAALENSTGKTVVIETAVDPELIGGVMTQVGSYRLDRSVKHQLETLRANLKAGAAS